MKLTDENVIREVQRGAVMEHPVIGTFRLEGQTFCNVFGHTYPLLTLAALDNRWSIGRPAPGACERCKGMGYTESVINSHRNIRCLHCLGTGEEPAIPGLMPDCEAWEWDACNALWHPQNGQGISQALLAEPDSGWTGRYGYAMSNRVEWVTWPRMWAEKTGNLHPTPPIRLESESITPRYVEMRKESK